MPSPNDSTTIRITPTAQRLAERYGVDPAEMEAIISDTYSDYAQGTRVADSVLSESKTDSAFSSAQPVIPPAAAAFEQAAAQAAARDEVAGVGSAHFPERESHHAVEAPATVRPVTPVEQRPVMTPSDIRTTEERRPGLSGVGIVLLLAALVAIIALFLFMKSRNHSTATTDSTYHLTPVNPSTTPSDSIPPEDTVGIVKQGALGDAELTKEPENKPSKPGQEPKAVPQSARRPASKSKPRTSAGAGNAGVLMTTTSNLAAQERLAEMRADGNMRAKLETVRKNGVTVYRIRK